MGEILYAITIDPSGGDYLQAKGSATVISTDFGITFGYTGAGDIVAHIDGGCICTIQNAKNLIDTRISAKSTEPSLKDANSIWVDTSGGTDTEGNLITTIKKRVASAWKSIKLKAESIVDFEDAVKAIIYRIADILQITWSMAGTGYFSFGPYLGGFIIQWGQNTYQQGITYQYPITANAYAAASVSQGLSTTINGYHEAIFNAAFCFSFHNATQANVMWIALCR